MVFGKTLIFGIVKNYFWTTIIEKSCLGPKTKFYFSKANPSLWIEDYWIRTHSHLYVFIGIRAMIYFAIFNYLLRDFDLYVYLWGLIVIWLSFVSTYNDILSSPSWLLTTVRMWYKFYKWLYYEWFEL